MAAAQIISPVAGRLSTAQAGRYGWRTHPVTGERTFHAGDDVACPIGTPVHAPEPGTIVYAGLAGHGLAAGRTGLCLIMRGALTGSEHYFGHCSRLPLAVGRKVDTLDVLAYSGNTGVTSGPHVHVEVRTLPGTLNTTAPAAWYAARGVTLGTDPTEDTMTPAQENKLDALAAAVQKLAAATLTETEVAAIVRKHAIRGEFDSGIVDDKGKPVRINSATAHRWTHNTLRELRDLIKEKK